MNLLERLGRWGSKYYLAPVILMPVIVFILPLLNKEVLFWGLPATQFIPWRVLAWQQLVNGMFPLWNPLNGLGAPLLANYQLAFFYPPGWILFGLMSVGGAGWMGWGNLLVNTLHLSWAGLGIALFVRDLGVSKFGQIISGLAFGLCAYFTARIGTSSMIWAGSWLPWLLLGGNQIIRWAKTESKFPPIFPGIALTFQLLAGHAQLTWYSIILFAAWTGFGLINSKNTKWVIRGFLATSIIVVLAIGLSAIQLLPTGEYLLNSQRSSAVDDEIGLTYSFWPWRLLTFLSPDFFGNPSSGNFFGYASYWEDANYLGFFPFVLALGTLPLAFRRYNRTRHNGAILFLWIIIIIGFLFALGKNTPIFPFFYRYIPTFDMFNAPTRFMIWIEFGLSVLAGIATSMWNPLHGNAVKRTRLIVAACAACSLGAGIGWFALGDVKVTYIGSIAIIGLLGSILGILALTQPKTEFSLRKWKLIFILLIGIDLFFNNSGKTPITYATFYSDSISIPEVEYGFRLFLDPVDEYSLKYSRFFRFGDFGQIEDWENLRRIPLPNLNLLSGISMVNNFDPLIPDRYARVMDEYSNSEDHIKLKILNWLSVDTQVEKVNTSPLGVAFRKGQPWARYRWLPCAEMTTNPEDAWLRTLSQIASSDQNEIRVAILETKPEPNSEACGINPSVRVEGKQVTSQQIDINIESNQKGYLVIANTYYPGWIATIDGRETSLFRVDYLFMGVAVDAGFHKVILEYRPQSFYTGMAVSGIFLAIVIISVIIRFVIKH